MNYIIGLCRTEYRNTNYFPAHRTPESWCAALYVTWLLSLFSASQPTKTLRKLTPCWGPGRYHRFLQALSISAGTAQWHSASARKFQRECLRDAVLRSFLYFGLKAKGHQMSISGLHGHMFPEETRHGGSSADGCLPPADGSAVRAHGQRKR